MGVDLNYLAVFLAAVSSMVVGSVWYLPATFGKTWMNLTGVKMDKNKGMTARKAAWTYGSVFVASLVTAYVLAHLSFLAHVYFDNSWIYDSVMTAFWVWLGFTAARLYVHDTFEERRKKLTLLNAAHELVTVLVMAVIIGWLHP